MITISKNFAKGALAIATGSLAFGSLMGVANATILTQTFTDSGAFLTLGSLGLPQSFVLSVPGFDSTLGPLKGVKLTINTQYGGDGGAENRSASAANLLLRLGADIGAVGPGINMPSSVGAVVAATVNSPNSPFAAGPFFPPVNYLPPSGFTDTFATVNGMKMVSYTDPDPALAGFIGGTLNYTIDSQSFSSATGAGDIASFFNTFGNANLEIVYSYHDSKIAAVPEPSAVLGLLGVAGIGALARRRKS